ncbi:MAG: transcription-repair coupling factor [Candidatus Dormibacteraeota bacterium]|uniref:Transcription-repair-coupling factor n=1 Tax=Candidatus Dormiibacter inghamiae TaxID=3127013 RepID=A0A934K9L3_9BACT|nr:transcription-repair coupling factor [Candidatus Dormibacteraeota bacterium]MBJ7605107.1 transcription-repair coupling factor [Candidatus Dormibacteraeota bacterium]
MRRLAERLFPEALRPWLEQALGPGRQSGEALSVGRLPRPAWAPLSAVLSHWATGQLPTLPVIVLCSHPARLRDELRLWLTSGPSALLFAEITVSLLDRPPAFDEAVAQRLEALAALAAVRQAQGAEPASTGARGCLLVSSRRAALRMTLSPQDLEQATLTLRPGLELEPGDLARRLVEMGYVREALAETPGQFSLRGGILDVFPAAARTPVRAEFFGAELETLRLYDPQNQRSVMASPEALIRPGRELLLGPRRGETAAARLRAEAGLEQLRQDVRDDWEQELGRLQQGHGFAGVELYGAYLDAGRPSLFDHLPDRALVLDFEPERQAAEAQEQERETLMLAEAEAGDGELPPGFVPPLVSADRLLRPPVAAWLQLSAAEPAAGETIDLGWRELDPVVGRQDALAAVVQRAGAGHSVVLASEQSERLGALLAEAGRTEAPTAAELDLAEALPHGLSLADVDLPAGCRLESAQIEFWSDAELFGRIRRQAARPPRRSSRGEATLHLEFQPGELVVHVDHGIARFTGMRLIDSDDPDGGRGQIQREYLELEYAEGDRLFVPVESLDRVQKYLGGTDEHPPLHRLGTGDWERARSRVNKSVQDVAEDLLRLYSQKEARPGFAFSPDVPWQAELEMSFPYEETPDQLSAMAEIKADMESERPMDRLLCGDVGFGKTELALRAAFKAVMSGKQVAVLAPTTVLVQQHYQVFSARLAKYPVTIEVLSRFRTEEEQKRTLAGVKAGAVDIVIATHRLLQRDVRFKRLGLLIIDEEQRFGVMQKERLRRLRANLDVLSLSATPIPRTMHMAVVGIRDMSVVQTPPEDRQPIKTYVTADDEELVREVLSREIDRGGQVFYVHNRVRSIDKAAERVRRLVKGARVAVGHGQMEEEQLARVMIEFAEGRHDVLVCTTIIESGLDIPNVNTMVVERADRFGLSQLYQLRGRVGRSGKRAYAYFLYDPRRSLTEAADKRLDVMSGLHELGQGFKIALRDLEIRGAGNLLGTEQHGAIAAVGFEMYLQMLQAAVAKLRSGAEEVEAGDVLTTPDINIDLPLDHFVPRSFIRDERLRLGAYRDLAAAETEAELEGALRSLRDRYGPAPAQLGNLVYSLRVKIKGQKLGLRSVAGDGQAIVLKVDPDRYLDVAELERRLPGRLKIGLNRLTMRRQGEGWRQDLLSLLDQMHELYELKGVAS